MSVKFNWPVYGHKKQIEFLQASLEQDKLAHAYLFYGPKGLGKKLIVQHFAKSLFPQHIRLIDNSTFPDLYTLGQDLSELNAESIKEFLAKLSLSAIMGGQKLAVIYQADQMNLFGFNALLKILEEPSLKTTIILVADKISNIPATVISRCQLLKFRPLDKAEMKNWLTNFKFNELEKATILNLSFGKPGLALEFINDRLASFKQQCDWLLKLLTNDTLTSLKSLDDWFTVLKKEWPNYKIYELGNLTVRYLELLELFLRDMLWINLGRPPANSLYEEKLKRIAGEYSLAGLLKNLLTINKLKNKIQKNISPQLLWENLILDLK